MIFYFPLKINNETKITFTCSKIFRLFPLPALLVRPSIGAAHDAAERGSSAEGCNGANHSCGDPVVGEFSITNSRTNVLVRILYYRHVLIRGMTGGSCIYLQVHVSAHRVVVED